MSKRGMSVVRIEEIRRLINEGQTNRFIARALGCRRSKVAEIRSTPEVPAQELASRSTPSPLWTETVNWEEVLSELGRGFELKRIWEEKARDHTTYSNFWKQLNRKYPRLLQSTVTLREFAPGGHCEVDYAGDRIEWMDHRGEIHEAHVFIGILCFSQYIFAWASENERSSNWLLAHQKMFAHFGGVPSVTVCDCLKNGVTKAHRYDPDINPAYTELASHYSTAVVPARPLHPKDKALAEGAVKLVMRLFRWSYRSHTFLSLAEVNQALALTAERINLKPHTRFKISRHEKWSTQEKQSLKPLPLLPFESLEWIKARVHPDSTIAADSATYSVPHIHRGKEVRVKLTAHHVEVFFDLQRLAIHTRDRNKAGARVIQNDHLPPNSQAYREATPQNVLSQARFIHSSLRDLIDELFQEDTLAHLRRAQGLVRQAHAEIQGSGRALAEGWIEESVKRMRRFNKIRVSYFKQILIQLKRERFVQMPDREIERLPGNPMLRQTAGCQHQSELLFPQTKEI